MPPPTPALSVTSVNVPFSMLWQELVLPRIDHVDIGPAIVVVVADPPRPCRSLRPPRRFTARAGKRQRGGRRLRHGRGDRRTTTTDGWPDIYVVNTGRTSSSTTIERPRSPTSRQARCRRRHARWQKDVVPSRLPGWTTTMTASSTCLSQLLQWEVNKDPFCGPNRNARVLPSEQLPESAEPRSIRNNGDGHLHRTYPPKRGIANIGQGNGRCDRRLRRRWVHGYLRGQTNRPNFLFHNLGARNSRRSRSESGVAYIARAARFPVWARFQDVETMAAGHLAHRRGERSPLPLYLNRETASSGREPCKPPCRGRATCPGGKWHFPISITTAGKKDLFVARAMCWTT